MRRFYPPPGRPRIFFVTYQLARLSDPRPIVAVLQKEPTQEWFHFIDNSWLITSHETASDLQDRIIAQMKQDDRLLVVQVVRGASWAGWLPEDAWDWMRQRIGLPTGTYPYL